MLALQVQSMMVGLLFGHHRHRRPHRRHRHRRRDAGTTEVGERVQDREADALQVERPDGSEQYCYERRLLRQGKEPWKSSGTRTRLQRPTVGSGPEREVRRAAVSTRAGTWPEAGCRRAGRTGPVKYKKLSSFVSMQIDENEQNFS